MNQPWWLFQGDCLDVMGAWPQNSVDAVVTDPPAGIAFMGKEWDDFRRARNSADTSRDNQFGRLSARGPEYARGDRDNFVEFIRARFAEALRLLKPGGHALVWAIPRTSHWTACGLEDAGFEIRDRVSHLFGTGFPKSLNIEGGYGTALKPAVEDWWLVRKPLDSTVADTFARWGTGVLSIDDCRIATDENPSAARRAAAIGRETGVWANDRRSIETYQRERAGEALGRWPAHLVLDEEAAAVLDQQTAVLDQQSGTLKSGAWNGHRNKPKTESTFGAFKLADEVPKEASSGGASRFFYVAKSSKAERNFGVEHFPEYSGGAATDREDGSAGLNSPRAGAGRGGGVKNHHPTLKSVSLMRWLTKLITRPGQLVLDPFAGSGTTGLASRIEGRSFVGIEQDVEFATIAWHRINAADRWED